MPGKKRKPYMLFGPCKPGGRYICGYWHKLYEVVSIQIEPNGDQWSITVDWLPSSEAPQELQWWISKQWDHEGVTRGTHMTRWDNRSDKIVSQPS